MRYQGGKSRIARPIVRKIVELSSEREIWEPFCGGGAVTLELARSGFRVHASDVHEDLILFWQAVSRGEAEVWADVSEAEHSLQRSAEPSARRGFVGFGASFGGGWFNGYGRSSRSKQPWQESQSFVARLRTQLHMIDFKWRDYVEIPDDVLVYADPPYAGVTPYKGLDPFDHRAFWNWVQRRSGATFVSELAAPDCISCVWEKVHLSQNASNSPTSRETSPSFERIERLFYKPPS